MNAQHTPGPWKVMPCPINKGLHPFHDQRWIATADTEPEMSPDGRSWDSGDGILICEMRDGPLANARLIAAAPELLEALEWAVAQIPDDLCPDHQEALKACFAAIAKARGA
jgi:hypothetical protein